MLHMYAAHTIHPYEEMYVDCVQLFACSMYAAHNNCTRVTYMYSDVCDLMCMNVACVWR